VVERDDSSPPAVRRGADAPRIARARRRAARRGHSLLEVLIALGLCVGLVIQVVLLNVFSRRVSHQAGAQAAAYLAVERQLDALRAQEWDARVTAASGGATRFFDVPESVRAQFFGEAGGDATMRGRYAVTPVSPTLQQASACVRWPNLSAPGKYSEACADTYFAKTSQP
jgi:Tfp pilus assembly protein PilV